MDSGNTIDHDSEAMSEDQNSHEASNSRQAQRQMHGRGCRVNILHSQEVDSWEMEHTQVICQESLEAEGSLYI